jgi:hypothetical protein
MQNLLIYKKLSKELSQNFKLKKSIILFKFSFKQHTAKNYIELSIKKTNFLI